MTHRWATRDGDEWECLNKGCAVHLKSVNGVPVIYDKGQPVLRGSRNSAREWSKAVRECKAIKRELQA